AQGSDVEHSGVGAEARTESFSFLPRRQDRGFWSEDSGDGVEDTDFIVIEPELREPLCHVHFAQDLMVETGRLCALDDRRYVGGVGTSDHEATTHLQHV